MDYLIHATICKHIHLVNIFSHLDLEQIKSSGTSSTTTSAAMLSDNDESTSMEYIESGSTQADSATSANVTFE